MKEFADNWHALKAQCDGNIETQVISSNECLVAITTSEFASFKRKQTKTHELHSGGKNNVLLNRRICPLQFVASSSLVLFSNRKLGIISTVRSNLKLVFYNVLHLHQMSDETSSLPGIGSDECKIEEISL